MPIVINTNLNSITAQRSLETVNRQLTQSIQRLSSGLRINSARDDASGLVIATRLTSQIRGLNAAVRNLSDGISLVQTAEGGISSITSNLQRIRELAVQSANITLTETERAALQSEVALAREEISRVAQQTTFNGRVLLNGTLGPGNFVAGANITDVLSFSGIEDLRATALGFNQTTGAPPTPVGDGPGGLPGFTRTNLSVLSTGTSVAQSITVLGTTYTLGSFAPGAKDLTTAINGLGVAGLTASVGANTLNGSVDSSYLNYFDPEGTLTINGVDIALVGSRSNNLSQNVDAAVASINARTIDTGVVASNGVSQGNGLVLTAADGRNLTVSFAASDINETRAPIGPGPGGVPGFIATNIDVTSAASAGAQNVNVLGTNYALGTFTRDARTLAEAINNAEIPGLSANAEANVYNGAQNSSYFNFFDPEGVLTLNQVAITLTGLKSNSLSQNVDLAVAVINAVSGQTGVTAANGTANGAGIILTAADGRNITVDFQATDINTQQTVSGAGPGGLPGFIANDIAVAGSTTAAAQSVEVLGTSYALGTFAPSANNLVSAINAAGIAGLTATANANVVEGEQDSSYYQYYAPQGILTINGVDIGLSANKTSSMTSNIATTINAINQMSAQTGVVAQNGFSDGKGVVLTAADGRTITVTFQATDVGNQTAPDYSTTAGNFGVAITGAAGQTGTIDLAYLAPTGVLTGDVTFSASTGLTQTNFDVVGELGPDTDPAPDFATVAGNFGLLKTSTAGVAGSISIAYAAPTGVLSGSVQFNSATGLAQTAFSVQGELGPDTDPAPDYLSAAGNFGITTTGPNGVSPSINISYVAPSGVLSGTVELSESTNVNDRVLQVVGSLQSPDFRSVANIDVSSITGANLAIQTIDGALQTVNSTRARLGGVLNRLDSAIDNLRVAEENQIAARSRIMDADIAAETAALARAQVLQESGIALLVQANAIPMNVVNLLRSSYL